MRSALAGASGTGAEVELERAAGRAFTAAAMQQALAGFQADDEAAFKRRLRRLRERVLLRTMARDLEQAASLAEVCGTMSDLADACILAALEWLGERELIVVAMGKLAGASLTCRPTSTWCSCTRMHATRSGSSAPDAGSSRC
jgi:glutamine synthetase adenylyltransferase